MSPEITSRADVDTGSERQCVEPGAQRRRHSLREAGVRFLFEMAAGMDADSSRQVTEFTEMACSRLGITEQELRTSQWTDALLRYHFGGEMVATLSLGPDGPAMPGEIAVLAAARPTGWDEIAERLNSLNGLLTDEERREITMQFVPRWSHDRPTIVSPLALYDAADVAQSAARPVGAGTAADG